MANRLVVTALVASSASIAIAAALVFGLTEARLNKTYVIKPTAVDVIGDPEQIKLGQHISETRGCSDCHSDDLGGKEFFNEPGVASVYASNLTVGAGGVAADYSDADWERAIRHGVGPDGKALLGMPSHEYFGFSDADVVSLIAYFRSLPGVDREHPGRELGPIGRILLLAGVLPPVAAELIDHEAPRPAAPPQGATVEYGRYLAAICSGCHGEDFSGSDRAGPPGSPPAPNLTADVSGIGAWSEADFVRALREGFRPDGTAIQGEFMPWSATSKMTDTELTALWIFLRSLPPIAD